MSPPPNDVRILSDVDYTLAWNPPKLHSAPLIKAKNTRLPSFYDKHFADHLVLKRVKRLDLVALIAGTVDDAYQKALKIGIPARNGQLLPVSVVKSRTKGAKTRMLHENSVAEFYSLHASYYCIPLASTLALHPEAEEWGSILTWSQVPNVSGYAISDGSLQIQRPPDPTSEQAKEFEELLGHVEETEQALIESLMKAFPDLAVWEMKNLVVGNLEEMEAVRRETECFKWVICERDCKRKHYKEIAQSKGYKPGPDGKHLREKLLGTTPPNPGDVGSTRWSLDDGGGMAAPRLVFPSLLPPEDDDELFDGPLPNLTQTDDGMSTDGEEEDDERKDPTFKTKQDVTAECFLQQAWAQAVRADSTFIVLHSGNFEIIGIRDRDSQTLYVSELIEPWNCSNPAYGKLQVGIYISAIQDALDRMRQIEDAQARFKGKRRMSDETEYSGHRKHRKIDDPDTDRGGGGGGYGDGGGGGGGHGDPPSNNGKGGSANGSRGDRAAMGRGGRGRGRGRISRCSGNRKGKTIAAGPHSGEDAAIYPMSQRNVALFHLRYGIYSSPHPAVFLRKTPVTVPTPPPPTPGRKCCHGIYESVDVVLISEIETGSIGVVHGGILRVARRDAGFAFMKIAVKMAFTEDDQEALQHEYSIYCHLESKGVDGIPKVLGLFVDAEGEGPIALIMSLAGGSLLDRKDPVPLSAKESFVTTLEAIHEANILHGDIRPANLCINKSGKTSIIDFSHSTQRPSRKKKVQEVRDLRRLLGMSTERGTKKESDVGLDKVDKTTTVPMTSTSKPVVPRRSQRHAAHVAQEKNTKILAGRKTKGR